MSTKNKISSLSLTSPAFKQNDFIPTMYTCAGKDISPPLKIEGVPKGTKSLALSMHDPDAPAGIWVHWLKWNISPSTIDIAEGVEPHGVSGKGTNNNTKYMGPCPPSGTHRYIFTLYALTTELSLHEGSSRDELIHAMSGHILDQAALVGLYTAN